MTYIKSIQDNSFIIGLFLTFWIAIIANLLVMLPIFQLTGAFILAMLIGLTWSTFRRDQFNSKGATFSSKTLLRIGIVLLGLRLNFKEIFQAGPSMFLIALGCLIFTLVIVYYLTKLFKVNHRLGILTACGTAICGAAAIVAIAPQIKAKDEEVAVSATIIALIGTGFTILYTISYPLLTISDTAFGVFAGATLHELAHVIAAAEPGGHLAVDIAVIVKLTRVMMLIPIALILGIGMYLKDNQNNKTFRSFQVPWFILGFIFTSCLNTFGMVPATIVEVLITIAYFLMTMAMAGLGLSVNFKALGGIGLKPFLAAAIGSVLLSVLGFLLVQLV
ncbi:YeiH family protein [Bacillus suaedae]|uniref:YeiH family protein n=1 Tax=Halalkalibacter suaedae TaxID=2822140 RepID=UPI001FF0B76B|nr:YeiH family protein [Bacillus suaedae]